MNYLRKTHLLVWIIMFTALASAMTGSNVSPVTAQSATSRPRIAFVTQATRTSTMELNLADPATGETVPLLKDGFFFWPMLSPDGRLIAFEGEAPRAGIRNLYIMNTDGSNLRLLIPGRPFLRPIGKVAWSSDSKQIIYPVIDSSRLIAGFFRANIDGSNAQKIAIQGVDSFRAAWIAASPDGKQLAVVAQNLKDYSAQLYIANADGSNAQPNTSTTPAGQPISELAWSPDSQKTLLGSGGLTSGNAAPQPLMLGDSNGANATILLKASPKYSNSFSWSPDGKAFAFLAIEPGDFKPDGNLWVANANGSGLRSLNIPINVASVGTSWSVIPDDVVLPTTPVSFAEASKNLK